MFNPELEDEEEEVTVTELPTIEPIPQIASIPIINDIENIWELTKDMTLFESKNYFEKQLILKRLKIHNGNIKNTAKSLGILRTNLYRKFKQLSVSKV